MKRVDTSVFVANAQDRIKPEDVDLGDLPPIERKPPPTPQPKKELAFNPLSTLPPDLTQSVFFERFEATEATPTDDLSLRDTVTPSHRRTSATSHQHTVTPF